MPEEYGNSYWGVPSWIKDKLVGNAKPFPWPFKQNRTEWVCDYFTEEILKGFGRFYKNYRGAADDFAKFWSIVAKRSNSLIRLIAMINLIVFTANQDISQTKY